uniref:Uncharacterized protein n=1 Tax=Romanomermis culicivorax TaxID=13658 RepID=A0A915L4P5_ROMCU
MHFQHLLHPCKFNKQKDAGQKPKNYRCDQ